MLEIRLDDGSRVELGRSLEGVCSPYEDFDRFRIMVYKAFSNLPESVLAEIFRFHRYPEAPGFLYLRNLPVEVPLSPTPTDGRPVTAKERFVSEACVAGLSLLLGEPIGFETEKKGDLIHNVVPVEAQARTQSNEGSIDFLAYHNDTVYSEEGVYNRYNPDYLVLHCLRQQRPQPVKTHFVEVREIVDKLPRQMIEILRQPWFEMAAPSTFTRERHGDLRKWSIPTPIISGPDDCPEICLAANGVRGINEEAARVLDELKARLHSGELGGHVELMPGDALLINNRKGLHARDSFEPRFDGSDRWLMRCYVRASTWDLRARRTDRPGVFQ
jgi:L-asparagine oxygenase